MNLPDIPGAPVEIVLFGLFALLAIVGAVSVVASGDPFISALSLLGNFAALGALYLFLDSPFVAIAQVIVYAGAVVVLFLFVIAYLGDRRELTEGGTRVRWLRPAGVAASVALLGVVAWVTLAFDYRTPVPIGETQGGYAFGSAQGVGEVFLTTYVLEFEVTSLVLLVAAIGGIVLGLTGRARHRRMRQQLGTAGSAATRQRLAREQRRAERRAEVEAAERARAAGVQE